MRGLNGFGYATASMDWKALYKFSKEKDTQMKLHSGITYGKIEYTLEVSQCASGEIYDVPKKVVVENPYPECDIKGTLTIETADVVDSAIRIIQYSDIK